MTYVKHCDHPRQTDQSREACVAPVAIILEIEQYYSRVAYWCHHPEWDDDGKQPSHMENEKDFYVVRG